MKPQPGSPSPQAYARLGGALYLIVIAAGLFGELFVRGQLVVPGDAAATHESPMTHRGEVRLVVGCGA